MCSLYQKLARSIKRKKKIELDQSKMLSIMVSFVQRIRYPGVEISEHELKINKIGIEIIIGEK